jgi:hypothetical protein
MNNIKTDTIAFRNLSASRRKKLGRDARIYIAQNPGCADNNRFWRSLSARKVRELAWEIA